MAIPRWQEAKKISNKNFLPRWEKLIAILVIINFSWIIFDISYLPLRSFWRNRFIFLFNSSSSTISLRWLPDITKYYDRFKGIQSYSSSSEIQSLFLKLDSQITNKGFKDSRTKQMLDIYQTKLNNILGANNISNTQKDFSKLAKIRNLILNRSRQSNLESANKKLLNASFIETLGWNNEKDFWQNKIIPILNSRYSRDINENGNYIDRTWEIDLPFQIIFLLDILIKVNIIQNRFQGIRLHKAFLKRWLDLPLLLPYYRFLRIFPVSERVLQTKLVPIEPIRSSISQWIVAFLAIEILEVLTIRTIDSIQSYIKSPILPQKIRGLCSYDSITNKENSEISEFLRIWIPLILRRIGPSMRNQLVELFEYALQKNIQANSFPKIIKENLAIEKAESAISFQLASRMVDTLLGLSKNAGNQIAKKDLELKELSTKTLDKFWEELANALERDSKLKESRVLLVSVLEGLKLSSLNELRNQAGVSEIISELNTLNFNSEKTPPKKSF